MNGEAVMLKNDLAMFSGRAESDEIAEIKAGEIESNEIKSDAIEISRIEIKETRFARLKKSLRKRSASIL